MGGDGRGSRAASRTARARAWTVFVSLSSWLMIGYFPDRDLLDSQAPRPGADVAQEAPRGFLIIVMTQSFLAS